MMIPPLPVGWHIGLIIYAPAVRLANLDRMQHRLNPSLRAGIGRRQPIDGASESSVSGVGSSSYRPKLQTKV
jgi:hypothetical protein